MVFRRTTPITALDLDSSDVPDASASSKGAIQLAGDLGGTASAPTVPNAVKKGDLVINVKDYGAVGDGAADDTAAIQAAITAAQNAGDRIAVNLGSGTFGTTGITLGNYTKLIGKGATLKLLSGTNPVITVPNQSSLQTSQYSLLEGVRVDGVSIAADQIGVKIGGHAAFIMRDVRATQLETGFSIVNGQFSTAYNCKADACTVGWYVESTLAGGGGNSWSFYDLQAVNNTIGVCLVGKSSGAYPFHSLLFRNPTLTGNSVCAFAAFYCNNVIIDGSANEANAGGASTASYQSQTIKKSSIYLSNSRLTFTNSYVAEASADPCILAENSSLVSLSDISGYGSPGGKLVSADATSSCSLAGSIDVVGVIDNATWLGASLPSAQLAVAAPAVVRNTPGIPNDFTSPQSPAFGDTNGVTSTTTGTDSVFGDYRSVTFAASASGQSTNRARVSTTYGGTTACMAVMVKSATATTLEMGVFGNVGVKKFSLPAGQWVRLVWLYVGVSTGAQSFIINPAGADGPTVQFCQWQQVSGTDSPTLRGQINAIFAGAYNNQTPPVVANGTTALTTSNSVTVQDHSGTTLLKVNDGNSNGAPAQVPAWTQFGSGMAGISGVSASLLDVRAYSSGNLNNPAHLKSRCFVSSVVTLNNQSGTVTLDIASGSVFVVNMTGNVTSLAFSNSVTGGEDIEVHFVQDATGSRTLAGVSGSIRLAGGALTLTTTASKRDIVRFRSISGTFYEVARSMNVG
jgi:Pectate lyase superfamily protein/Repeat of unknown function (DUF5907)